MPSVIRLTGYISKEEAARQNNITLRTLNDWLNRYLAAARGISYIKADGFVYVRDKNNTVAAPPVPVSALEAVTKFAERNGLYFERVYEQIIMDNISAVIIVDRVFVINTEPELLAFLKNHKRRKKKPTYK